MKRICRQCHKPHVGTQSVCKSCQKDRQRHKATEGRQLLRWMARRGVFAR